MCRFVLVSTLCLATTGSVSAVDPIAVDCSQIAFYPDQWKANNVSFEMQAWSTDSVVFLTTPGEYDTAKLTQFVRTLDNGWKTYTDLVGKTPRLFRQIDGKPTICALPKPNLSCGYGCGYVGATGIEVAGFYTKDWPTFQQSPETFAHYYFYEMGRNFYVFGDRHSLYTTGYAVFMRYVCMDRLKCKDADLATRGTIERCEQIYADSNVSFLQAFTNFSAGEKGHRLKDPATGRTVVPSDQPVMYASAMLKLRRDYGDDAWVKKFLHLLHECPPVKAIDEATAVQQSLNWLACASAAAGKDLSPVFVDRWRMQLTVNQQSVMSQIDWAYANPNMKDILKRLSTR